MIFQKRIGAWVRASAEALRLFPLFQRRSLLQYSSHRNYKSFRNAVLHQDDLCNALVLHQGHCFFYVAKMQQYFYHFWSHKDHLLDDDFLSSGFWEYFLLFWRFFSQFLFFFQVAGHNDVELYNQYLERLRHFVSQELTNWHKAEATETASASATSNNQVNVVKNEPKSQDQTNNTTTTATSKTGTTGGNNTNTTTSSSSLSISNQDSADKTTKNNSEKFLWKR